MCYILFLKLKNNKNGLIFCYKMNDIHAFWLSEVSEYVLGLLYVNTTAQSLTDIFMPVIITDIVVLEKTESVNLKSDSLLQLPSRKQTPVLSFPENQTVDRAPY